MVIVLIKSAALKRGPNQPNGRSAFEKETTTVRNV